MTPVIECPPQDRNTAVQIMEPGKAASILECCFVSPVMISNERLSNLAIVSLDLPFTSMSNSQSHTSHHTTTHMNLLSSPTRVTQIPQVISTTPSPPSSPSPHVGSSTHSQLWNTAQCQTTCSLAKVVCRCFVQPSPWLYENLYECRVTETYVLIDR